MSNFSIKIKPTELSLDHTLGCAQAFTWKKQGKTWHGKVNGAQIAATQTSSKIVFETDLPPDYVRAYFNLSNQHDLPSFIEDVLAKSNQDAAVAASFKQFPGLRILKQDPWETLAGFILSQNSNVKMIEQRVERLCNLIGNGTFPNAEQIASASEEKMKQCSLGYRTAYLIDTSNALASGEVSLTNIEKMPHEEARVALMELPGIGPKVADCICLYSFNQWESFPVDTHVNQVLHELYGKEIASYRGSKKHLGYDDARRFATNKFGKYCGYAQQYLFHAHRIGTEL